MPEKGMLRQEPGIRIVKDPTAVIISKKDKDRILEIMEMMIEQTKSQSESAKKLWKNPLNLLKDIQEQEEQCAKILAQG